VGIHQLEVDDHCHQNYYNSSKGSRAKEIFLLIMAMKLWEGKGFTMTAGKVYPKPCPLRRGIKVLKVIRSN